MRLRPLSQFHREFILGLDEIGLQDQPKMDRLGLNPAAPIVRVTPADQVTVVEWCSPLWVLDLLNGVALVWATIGRQPPKIGGSMSPKNSRLVVIGQRPGIATVNLSTSALASANWA